ncbi:MAG TPA: IS110 family transposase [Solirubrobacterales bacterium]|nr:IS110 family transposase [Solirubrobacterales bacterium]
MLHAGLDLSRRKLDVCLLSDDGEYLDQLVSPPDVDALRMLARRIDEVHGEPVCAVVESMTGARLVHDTLEHEGWDVEIADAQKVKGLAPLACKTDKTDSLVLATLSQRDLVPAIWLPDPRVREERELARFRMHLVKHKSALKCRIHSTLINFGRPCPVTDLFGAEGRTLLAKLEVPEPWRSNVSASIELIDHLEDQIEQINRRLKAAHADHPYIPLLMSVPGIRWVLAFTIAAEIGEIERFPSPQKLTGYTGLCPRVVQSGEKDRRGPLTKHGPTYLRWALLEATMHALRHPAYSTRYQRTKHRLGKQRGAKVAQVDIARRLAHAIWHMLTRNEEFAPRGAAFRLAA